MKMVPQANEEWATISSNRHTRKITQRGRYLEVKKIINFPTINHILFKIKLEVQMKKNRGATELKIIQEEREFFKTNNQIIYSIEASKKELYYVLH